MTRREELLWNIALESELHAGATAMVTRLSLLPHPWSDAQWTRFEFAIDMRNFARENRKYYERELAVINNHLKGA